MLFFFGFFCLYSLSEHLWSSLTWSLEVLSKQLLQRALHQRIIEPAYAGFMGSSYELYEDFILFVRALLHFVQFESWTIPFQIAPNHPHSLPIVDLLREQEMLWQEIQTKRWQSFAIGKTTYIHKWLAQDTQSLRQHVVNWELKALLVGHFGGDVLAFARKIIMLGTEIARWRENLQQFPHNHWAAVRRPCGCLSFFQPYKLVHTQRCTIHRFQTNV